MLKITWLYFCAHSVHGANTQVFARLRSTCQRNSTAFGTQTQ